MDIIEETDTDIVENIVLEEDIKKLHSIIRRVLTEREREIITMRYGLVDSKEVTQREIANKLGISRSYVSRIEKKALKKLREYFNE